MIKILILFFIWKKHLNSPLISYIVRQVIHPQSSVPLQSNYIAVNYLTHMTILIKDSRILLTDDSHCKDNYHINLFEIIHISLLRTYNFFVYARLKFLRIEFSSNEFLNFFKAFFFNSIFKNFF